MTDMPSYGSLLVDAANEDENFRRADEFFVLLSNGFPFSAEEMEVLRRFIGADYDVLAEMDRTDGGTGFDTLRNLEEYGSALARVAGAALHRIADVRERTELAEIEAAGRAEKETHAAKTAPASPSRRKEVNGATGHA